MEQNKELAQMNEQELRVDIQGLVRENQELRTRLDSALMQLEDTAHALRTFNNPFKAILSDLLTNDDDFKTLIENEVDDQIGTLKDEVLDEIDDKLDEQFDTYAFKSAVDNHLRSKF